MEIVFLPYKVQFFLKMREIAISINLKNKQKILSRSSCNFKRNNGVNISGGNISGVNFVRPETLTPFFVFCLRTDQCTKNRFYL